MQFKIAARRATAEEMIVFNYSNYMLVPSFPSCFHSALLSTKMLFFVPFPFFVHVFQTHYVDCQCQGGVDQHECDVLVSLNLQYCKG